MPVFIASLNSGSNANCYYIGDGRDAVLIDAGLSCRETVKRMQRLGLDMQTVKAVFISHEHTDHIAGLETLHKTFQLPVYITPATLRKCNLLLQEHLIRSFTRDVVTEIGSLKIFPFSKSHDADDPHSFMISSDGVQIGVMTDIGYACEQVINCFRQCHAVFLESNYCADMLANGNYPFYLKRRISSSVGHLSNDQALEIFRRHRSEILQLLILSHLSKNNNSPELVHRVFAEHATGVRIIVASRDKESEVFEILPGPRFPLTPPHKPAIKTYTERPVQLSLF